MASHLNVHREICTMWLTWFSHEPFWSVAYIRGVAAPQWVQYVATKYWNWTKSCRQIRPAISWNWDPYDPSMLAQDIYIIFNNYFFSNLNYPQRAYYYKFGSFPILSNVKEGLVVYGLVARRKGFRASHWKPCARRLLAYVMIKLNAIIPNVK